MKQGRVKRMKVKAHDFHFRPVKGWTGRPVQEKLGSWSTRLFEASGKVKVTTWTKKEPRR